MLWTISSQKPNSRTPNKNNLIQPAVGSSTTHSFNAFDSVPCLIESKIKEEMSFKFCYKKYNPINEHPLIIYNLFKRFSLGYFAEQYGNLTCTHVFL